MSTLNDIIKVVNEISLDSSLTIMEDNQKLNNKKIINDDKKSL